MAGHQSRNEWLAVCVQPLDIQTLSLFAILRNRRDSEAITSENRRESSRIEDDSCGRGLENVFRSMAIALRMLPAKNAEEVFPS